MDLTYREAYVINREAARMRLVETCLKTGSISETARRRHTSQNVALPTLLTRPKPRSRRR